MGPKRTDKWHESCMHTYMHAYMQKHVGSHNIGTKLRGGLRPTPF